MGNLFGKEKVDGAPSKAVQDGRSKVSDHDRAVLKLKMQRDNLNKFRKKVEAQSDKLQAGAKARAKNGDKKGALQLLKLRKYQMQQIETVDGQLFNLEQMTGSIEFAQLNAKVIEGIEQGNAALDALNKACSIERVEEAMYDLNQGIEYSNEVNELISQSQTTESEADLQAELDAMAAAMAELEGGVDVGVGEREGKGITADQLPSVPDTPLPAVVVAPADAAQTAAAAAAPVALVAN